MIFITPTSLWFNSQNVRQAGRQGVGGVLRASSNPEGKLPQSERAGCLLSLDPWSCVCVCVGGIWELFLILSALPPAAPTPQVTGMESPSFAV